MHPIADALRQCLVTRHISKGLSTAAEAVALLEESLSLASPDPIQILAWLSIWIDVDFTLRSKVEDLSRKLLAEGRGDYLHRIVLLLDFIEATLQMHNEKFESAAQTFRMVTAHGAYLSDNDLLLIAHFYQGRCLHYLNQFDPALECCRQACVLGQTLSSHLQTAGVDVLSSRVLLKSKPLKKALPLVDNLLKSSHEVFKSTDDYVTKANVLIFQAQVARRGPHQGESALNLLTKAISGFLDSTKDNPERQRHPVLARGLLHRSRVERDEALVLNQRLESETTSFEYEHNACSAILDLEPRIWHVLRHGAALDLQMRFKNVMAEMQKYVEKTRPHHSPAVSKQAISELQKHAVDDARAAAEIYKHLGHLRGLGNSWVSEGNILLDRGEYQEALEIAKRAVDLGRQTSETILTRAALLASDSAAALVEEAVQADEDYIQTAVEFSDLAYEHASKTEPRIIARAHVRKARTMLLLNPDEKTRREIESLRDEAQKTARNYQGRSLQRDLEKLQSELNPDGKAAATLRTWIETRSGATFSQLEACITRLAWESTRNMSGFIKLLDLSTYNHAHGLLTRAGILKMQDRQAAKSD